MWWKLPPHIAQGQELLVDTEILDCSPHREVQLLLPQVVVEPVGAAAQSARPEQHNPPLITGKPASTLSQHTNTKTKVHPKTNTWLNVASYL